MFFQALLKLTWGLSDYGHALLLRGLFPRLRLESLKDLLGQSTVTAIGKVNVAETLEELHMRQMGMMLSKCVVVLYYIICPDQDIIHRDEEVDGHVYQVVVLQVVQRGLCTIMSDIVLSSIVICLEFTCPIDFIKVLAQVC